MDNKLIDLEAFKKQYVVISQSQDLATNTIQLNVYDIQEKVYKILKYDKYIFYKFIVGENI